MDKWDYRMMEMAELVSSWSSCFKMDRQVGAVIAKDKRILTTGYNGASSGVLSCKDKGYCMRIKLNIPSGTRQEMCYAVHAEQNAIIQAAKLGVCVEGSTLYCTHKPCSICAKLIINAGVVRVVYKHEYTDNLAVDLLAEAKVMLEKIECNN